MSTNFHTELKPQVNVSHDMNSPAFTLYATMGVRRREWLKVCLAPPWIKKIKIFLENRLFS